MVQDKELNGIDKIRILLLDDEPGTLARNVSGSKSWRPKLYEPDDAVEPLGIKKHFELRWLAEPGEARQFRDLSAAISLKQPQRLLSDGFVPEIVCFDYALTGEPRAVEHRDHVPKDELEQISPLPALRRLAKSMGIPVSEMKGLPDSLQRQTRTDCYGLYVGVLLYDTFIDHPLAPVAVTRYPSQTITENQDGQFFEWFLQTKHGETFSRRGRPAPSWEELIIEGVKTLQVRIRELFCANAIQVDLDDLMKMSRGKHHVLTIGSRYGVRRLPVQGLFIGEQDIPDAASKWAKATFLAKIRGNSASEREQVVQELGLDVIRRAITATEELWKARLDQDNEHQLTRKRMRLSELMALKGNSDSKSELEILTKQFDADIQRDTCPKTAHWVRDIRNYDKEIQRWVVLFTVVRALHHSYVGRIQWQKHCKKEGWNGPAMTSLAPPLDFREIYVTLFPRAYQPIVIPWEDPTSRWGNSLHRHAVRPNEVLQGKGVSCLEQMLMRDYALSLGFTRAQWIQDEQARLVLGETE